MTVSVLYFKYYEGEPLLQGMVRCRQIIRTSDVRGTKLDHHTSQAINHDCKRYLSPLPFKFSINLTWNKAHTLTVECWKSCIPLSLRTWWNDLEPYFATPPVPLRQTPLRTHQVILVPKYWKRKPEYYEHLHRKKRRHNLIALNITDSIHGVRPKAFINGRQAAFNTNSFASDSWTPSERSCCEVYKSPPVAKTMRPFIQATNDSYHLLLSHASTSVDLPKVHLQ